MKPAALPLAFVPLLPLRVLWVWLLEKVGRGR
jgi:hypothetical protein